MIRARARARAAAVFAGVALSLAAIWFLPSIWARADIAGAALYLVAPTAAAWGAGWLIGYPLCAPPEGYGPARAVLTGAAVASLALLVFGAVFLTAILTLGTASDGALGRTASVALLATTALGPVILLVGASTGLFLYRYGRGRPAEESEDAE